MRINQKSAVLDVDGVLLDFLSAFKRVAAVALARPIPCLNRSYDLRSRLGLSQTEIGQVLESMNNHDHGWKGMPAFPGAANAVSRLRSHGYDIHLVTAIPESLRGLRLACLEANGIVPDSIHCAGHHAASKSEIIQKLAPVMFVDDLLRHLHEAPFVPNRVFIDQDTDQDGYVLDEDIIYATSLDGWVSSWELAKGYRSKLSLAA